MAMLSAQQYGIQLALTVALALATITVMMLTAGSGSARDAIRYWVLAFALLFVSSYGVIIASDAQFPWLGDVCTGLAPAAFAFVWSGHRRMNGRSPRAWVGGILAVLFISAFLVSSAMGAVYAAAIAAVLVSLALAAFGVREVLRHGMHTDATGLLQIVMLGLIVLTGIGAIATTIPVFSTPSTDLTPANYLTAVAVMAYVFTTVVTIARLTVPGRIGLFAGIPAADVARRLLDDVALSRAARTVLARAARRGEPAWSLIDLRIDGIDDLRTLVFTGGVGDDVPTERFRRLAVDALPAASLIGEIEEGRIRALVPLLPDDAQAAADNIVDAFRAETAALGAGAPLCASGALVDVVRHGYDYHAVVAELTRLADATAEGTGGILHHRDNDVERS